MKRMLRLIGLTALILMVSVVGIREMLDYRNKADFDRTKWREAPNCVPDGCESACIRGAMVRDLQRRHLIPGTPRSEVMTLLGDAKTRHTNNQKFIDYDLGMCSGFRMDFDSLVILFDGDDRVVRSWTEQH